MTGKAGLKCSKLVIYTVVNTLLLNAPSCSRTIMIVLRHGRINRFPSGRTFRQFARLSVRRARREDACRRAHGARRTDGPNQAN
jgi:hypothetical protein